MADGRVWADGFDEWFDVWFDEWFDEVIGAAPSAGSVWWAVEEQCLDGVDGRRYAVAECGNDVFTLSVGFASVVCEVEVPVPGGIGDGCALLVTDSGVTRATTAAAARLVWLGPATGAAWHDYADDAAGLELVGAVSEDRLGALVAASVATVRPDVTVRHDPEWTWHRHPLRGLFERLDIERLGVDGTDRDDLDDLDGWFEHELPASWTDGTFHADPID